MLAAAKRKVMTGEKSVPFAVRHLRSGRCGWGMLGTILKLEQRLPLLQVKDREEFWGAIRDVVMNVSCWSFHDLTDTNLPFLIP